MTKNIKKHSKSVFLILNFLLSLISTFVSNDITIQEADEKHVIQVENLYMNYAEEGAFQSKKVGINWINDELKKNVSSEIINNFRVVSKDNLKVRKGKTKNSRIAGQLSTGNVVQILEKKKNWSYIMLSHYEDEEITEGWTLTRYLKQIK